VKTLPHATVKKKFPMPGIRVFELFSKSATSAESNGPLRKACYLSFLSLSRNSSPDNPSSEDYTTPNLLSPRSNRLFPLWTNFSFLPHNVIKTSFDFLNSASSLEIQARLDCRPQMALAELYSSPIEIEWSR